jgi:hypothetical protein
MSWEKGREKGGRGQEARTDLEIAVKHGVIVDVISLDVP